MPTVSSAEQSLLSLKRIQCRTPAEEEQDGLQELNLAHVLATFSKDDEVKKDDGR
jgi:hypothetical protein